jgi:hypothetical protein
MALAWKMYVEDSRETVPYSYNPGNPSEWVHGSLDFITGNRSNWDVNQDITKSILMPYCGNATAIWKCPADNSFVKVSGVTYSRVRSVSMNAWFNSTDVDSFTSNCRIYKKMDDLIDPGPSMTWLFLDEREDSINDGEFVVSLNGYPSTPGSWTMVDFPASYHNHAAGFSFADGHSEIKRWLDARTMPVLKKNQGLPLNQVQPNSKDVYWLMDHSTRKK